MLLTVHHTDVRNSYHFTCQAIKVMSNILDKLIWMCNIAIFGIDLSLCPSQHFFSYVRMSIPGLNQF